MKQLSCWLLVAATNLASVAALAEDQVVTLLVTDISCSNCTSMIKRVLGRIEGVKNITVKADNREAVVTFDNNRTNTESLIDVAALAGYLTQIKHK